MVNHTVLTHTPAHIRLKSNVCTSRWESHVGRCLRQCANFCCAECAFLCGGQDQRGTPNPEAPAPERSEEAPAWNGSFHLAGRQGTVQQQMLLKSGLEHACAVSPPRAGLPLLQVPGSVGRASHLHWPPHKMHWVTTAKANAIVSLCKFRGIWGNDSLLVLFEEQYELRPVCTVLLEGKFIFPSSLCLRYIPGGLSFPFVSK